MTRRRFASTIAGAAGLIAVTTLLARIAGFARILVFADAVRAGGVGEHLPERQRHPQRAVRGRGGRHPRRGRRAAHRPAARRGGARAGRPHGIRAAHLDPRSCSCRWRCCSGCSASADLRRGWSTTSTRGPHEVAATLLRIFAVQVPLYGAGHHPHRPAPGPPALPRGGAGAARLVDRRAGVLPLVRLDRRAARSPRRWSATRRSGCSAGAPRSVSSCSRCRWSCRRCAPAGAGSPALRMPREDARRIGALAGAGVIALRRPAGRRARHDAGSRSSPATAGTFTVYTYVQAVYLLPYAVLAVPVATSAFPALAARTGAGEDVIGHPRAGAARRARADRAVGGRPRRRRARHRRVLHAARRPTRGARARARRPWPPCPARSPPTPRAWSASASPRCSPGRSTCAAGRPMPASPRRWAGPWPPCCRSSARRHGAGRRRRRCAGWASRRRSA